jgi:hypothetical protein
MLPVVAMALAAAQPDVRVTPVRTDGSSRSLAITPAQMLRFAQLRQESGDLMLAEKLYRALEADPDVDVRNEARFRHSKMLEAEGRNSDAGLLLRRILDEKPNAAPVRLALAQILDRMGDKEGAWRQVRAAQASGLPPAVARLVDRYSEALRASRPSGASFEIALAPDSNINRATRSDTLGTVLGDFSIDDHSKAQSGTGLALSGQAFRRFDLGGSGAGVLLRLSGLADLYRKARFNDIAVDLAAGPELRLGRNQIDLEIGATQRWYGQKPFMRSARLGATWTRPLGSRMQVRLGATAALVDNQMNDLQDGKSYAGRIEVERALSATTGIGLNAAIDREALRDPGYATTGWRAGIVGWRDLGRMTFTAEASLGRLHADERLLLFPQARADRYSRFSLAATFRQLQFHGFAPIARFSIERNRSTVEFYDYRRVRSEMGVVRAF